MGKEAVVHGSIERSLQCHRACVNAIDHVLGGAPGAAAELTGLLVRCAAASKAAADLLEDESDLGTDALRLAALVCAEGEDACRPLGDDDPVLARCADACASVVAAYADVRE